MILNKILANLVLCDAWQIVEMENILKEEGEGTLDQEFCEKIADIFRYIYVLCSSWTLYTHISVDSSIVCILIENNYCLDLNILNCAIAAPQQAMLGNLQ